MARKRFLQDIDRAKAKTPSNVTEVEQFDGDGVAFNYHYWKHSASRSVRLRIIAANIDEYPDGNHFIFYTEDANVDPIIAEAFEHIQASIDGSSITTALREISTSLNNILEADSQSCTAVQKPSSQSPPASDRGDDDFDGGDLDDDYNDDASFGLTDMIPPQDSKTILANLREYQGSQDFEAMRFDLSAAKEAGFKIGVHGDLMNAGIVCVSIRVTKLGISEEAMRAWGLLRSDYFVLLIRFHQGYKSLAYVKEMSKLVGPVEMRVALCDSYKPRAEEAFAIFDQVEGQPSSVYIPPKKPSYGARMQGTLRPLFIGRAINDLLRERFPKIIKFREQFKLRWHGAEKLFNDRQSALFSDLEKDLTPYRVSEVTASARALPSIVTMDHLTINLNDVSDASLPLVAMQFVLRHFVRCTDFCLVCHCTVSNTFEALKPYVCSNPLCLYQFLALGFGPSAEWEILSQPFVIDLLISLCYSQVISTKLKEYPTGMSLKIPVLPHFRNPLDAAVMHGPHYGLPVPQATKEATPEAAVAFKAKFDQDTKMLSPEPSSRPVGKRSLKLGDWIVLASPYNSKIVRHGRIRSERGLDFLLDPVIDCTKESDKEPGGSKKPTRSVTEVDCYLYDSDFDSLPKDCRLHAISMLLDILPSVNEMRKVLAEQQARNRDLNLNALRKRCPPVALELLRWIVASNRSCIMQVDDVALDKELKKPLLPAEDRVSGMDEWMQFRFAQGAPDKEQRFIDSVKRQSGSTQYPTLFAWHGSPLHNWHSIIRQGLNFDEVTHGRANGNGVYMSPFLSTSLGYTVSGVRSTSLGLAWPNSVLQVSNVVSLQEVVNAPKDFVSCNPHFVVADKDWIQTRYLFVKTTAKHSVGSKSKAAYPQDPKYAARGSQNETIAIPITAISQSRRPAKTVLPKTESKRRKLADEDTICFDDTLSVMTDQDDRDLLEFSHEDEVESDDDDTIMSGTEEAFRSSTRQFPTPTSSSRSRKRGRESFILDSSKTDFVPGALDMTGIRLLNPPGNATPTATRALMKAFDETMRTQETTPLHELGFYIDREKVDNMYQWIVELHSFEQTLPLAKDMRSAGIPSIVFEMQFTNDFPFSPPFVRVVKPRFLDPMSGGGGHITSGGAICMELLTSTGWSAANSIESVLLQVRLAMSETERPARLLKSRGHFQTSPYGIGEAVAAYRRFCQRHGWTEPKGLDSLQSL